ncbi:IS66 family transposase [Thiosulfatimonas sediminis]|uniref:IS66 family transposase n=1 Tax=Thiosulfatimonas sediminis TaxID=2675054 RepID=UPI003C7CA054
MSDEYLLPNGRTSLKRFLLNQPVLHADETPVPMLKAVKKKIHKVYLWTYTNTSNVEHNAVYYYFS